MLSSRTVELRSSGRSPPEPDTQRRQEACPLVVQPLGAGDAVGSDVTVTIENGESVAVFEHTRTTQRQR